MTADAQFFALEPDAETRDFVRACKEFATARVGTQTYLSDEAHLTLYVGAFAHQAALEAAVSGAVPEAAVTVPLKGWTTFQPDPVTGGNTLVLGVADAGMPILRELQLRIVKQAAPCRAAGILPRYRDTRRYTPEMIASRDAYGFPFVGKIWKAHLTIASFTPEAYARVAPDLLERPPPASVRFEALTLNLIRSGGFGLLRRWRFGDV